MVRICHVQCLPLMSGVQRSMLEIFKQLDRTRCEIHVVCKEAGPLTEHLDQLGIPVHLAPALARPIRPLRDLEAYRQLVRIFRRQRFELVHTHSSKPGILGRMAARAAGVPRVVHHVRGFAFHEFSSPRARWAYGQLERWGSSLSDRVIFVNHEERELAVGKRWVPHDRCLTIYNGADLEALAPSKHEQGRAAFRQRHQIADDELAITVIGRLSEQKQPLILPEIAVRLDALTRGRRWRMIVAGSGPLESRLARLAQHIQGRRLQLIGWQAEPEQVYRGSDIVLLPSLWEGLPRTLIEAQAAALPTVASNVKGNREVVSADTGFLCQPREASSYAQALATLIHDQVLRARLSLAARARAEKLFDTVTNNRRIVQLYEQLLRVPRLGLQSDASNVEAISAQDSQMLKSA